MGKHICDNCGTVHNSTALVEASSMLARTDPGGVVPSGDCPDCGAFCYPIKSATVSFEGTDLLVLLHAARNLLANRVPIPDKESDYVPRVFIKNLRDAVEKMTGEKVDPC